MKYVLLGFVSSTVARTGIVSFEVETKIAYTACVRECLGKTIRTRSTEGKARHEVEAIRAARRRGSPTDAARHRVGFLNRTFAQYFEDEFDVEIYDERYAFKGDSKANRLRAFIEVEDDSRAKKVLRRLLERERTIEVDRWLDDPKFKAAKLAAMDELLSRLEAGALRASTDAIERFERGQTLDELVAAIGRDVDADRPEAALGHLHTYCMKRFGHLLDVRGVAWDRKESLHARVGKYRQVLDAELPTHEMTRQIVRNAVGMLEKFNDIRNNRSLAHDNVLLRRAEARFVFDSVVAVLRFVKAVEVGRFEDPIPL